MSATWTTITLARHGRTPWHTENRYTGVSDIPIDDEGVRQSYGLAEWARTARPDVLYTSTMVRARQTARPAAEALRLPVHADGRLRELDFGEAEGRTLDELRRAHPEAVERFERDPVTHHLPGGEKPQHAADRATEALSEIADRHRGQHILVICHNTLIRLALCRYLEIPLQTYRHALRGLDPAGTARLSVRPSGVVTLDHYNRILDGPVSPTFPEVAGDDRVR